MHQTRVTIEKPIRILIQMQYAYYCLAVCELVRIVVAENKMVELACSCVGTSCSEVTIHTYFIHTQADFSFIMQFEDAT